MAHLPLNVDKSAFRRGEYITYDPRGNAWRVYKTDRDWHATPSANNPARGLGVSIIANTLTAVAASIASRQPAHVVEPF